LALDDLHLVTDNAIHAFLTRLIQLASDCLHLVLITRVDPPLPLNRWRAQGQLNELRIHDLGFTLEETTTFLCENLEKTPSTGTAAVLHELTEGWAVGLRLVALALRGVNDYASAVAGFQANSNRYIIDYLMDDVLDQLPPATQQFLSATALLTRFCPALCAAVLEIDESTAREHINYMARANLFLIELSSPANWYRYHHQFQSMLLSRLHERYDQQAIETLHRQAAAWLAAHAQVDEALRHLTAIPDFAAAAGLIESQRVAALNEQRFHDLDEWLAMLPVYVLNQRPVLLLSLAWVQHHWLNDIQSLAAMRRAALLLDGEAASLSEETRKLLQTEIVLLQIGQDRGGDQAEILALIHEHWRQIRPYLAHAHCTMVVTLSHFAYFLGGGELALEILLTAFEQTIEWSHMARARLLYSAGILYWYNCNLAQAERVFQQSLYLARQHNLHLAMTLAHFGLALVACERNQQEQAEAYQLEVIKEPHYQNGLRAVFCTYTLIGMYAARGQPEAGYSLIEQLKAHALLVGRPYLLNQVEALEAYLALHCGDLAAALRWALAASRSEMYSPEDRIPLIRVQILMAEGSPDSLRKASQLLEELTHQHEREHRWSLWIETLILEALTWAKSERLDLALIALGKAVLRAVPNGVVGHFIMHGQPLARLLLELGKQPEYTQLVQLLLAAFPSDQGGAIEQEDAVLRLSSVVSSELVEPLTEREQEVLKLLVGRLSNKEIAHHLIVSPHTVRNHTANIFSKLQVANRFQAVARARSLGILPPAE
jgi:LuxR family maltose regulon positive regulatory protein